MKLKTIKTYQSVRFNQKDETHFDSRIPRFEGLILTFNEEAGYVLVSQPGKESVIVFSTNIAYAVIADEPVQSVKKASKG
jgi:hypothetical protein